MTINELQNAIKDTALQIGDWVMYDNCPYQIRQLGIFDEDRAGNDYPAVCIGRPQGIGLIVERNEIHPISLTQEILYNSGFLYGIHYSENISDDEIIDSIIDGYHVELPKQSLSYIDGSVDISIYFPDENDRGKVAVSNKDKNINIEAFFDGVIYVHWLQQAMRLCGIEKEIIKMA